MGASSKAIRRDGPFETKIRSEKSYFATFGISPVHHSVIRAFNRHMFRNGLVIKFERNNNSNT
jgi:hypothetical protein